MTIDTVTWYLAWAILCSFGVASTAFMVWFIHRCFTKASEHERFVLAILCLSAIFLWAVFRVSPH